MLRVSAKGIFRFSNIYYYVMFKGHITLSGKHLALSGYVNGVIEILCKYLQSARHKYRLADGSTLRAWHLQGNFETKYVRSCHLPTVSVLVKYFHATHNTQKSSIFQMFMKYLFKTLSSIGMGNLPFWYLFSCYLTWLITICWSIPLTLAQACGKRFSWGSAIMIKQLVKAFGPRGHLRFTKTVLAIF